MDFDSADETSIMYPDDGCCRTGCGICTMFVDLHEPYFGIRHLQHIKTLDFLAGPSPWTAELHPAWINDFSAMRSCDTAAFHRDCFLLFIREAKVPSKMTLLFKLSHWRLPWDGATPLDLPDSELFVPSKQEWNALGIPVMAGLPVEISSMVFQFSQSPDALLDRLIRARLFTEDVSYHLSDISSLDEFTLPLKEIESWQRGQAKATLVSEDNNETYSQDLVTRVVVDSHGVSRIERIEDMDSSFPEQDTDTKFTRYGFFEGDYLEDTKVQFWAGFARLTLPQYEENAAV